MSRRGVGVGTVLVVALVVGGVTGLLWQFLGARGQLVPAPPWLGAVLLVLLSLFVLGLTWPVRRYLEGKSQRPLDPIRSARALVFAQAGALTGGACTGWYAAQLLTALRHLDLLVYQDRAWRLGLMVLLSGALAAAGLVGQSWCRVSSSDDETKPPAGDPLAG